ncbi:S41 family peptidase [Qipengyuania sp. MTN3-11]|uniref:S41 family peptidase n=1 Tax=Qipengyuania sp. MTN3-11 TaxID=3056557 RepID=UPI0036F1D17B
MKSLRFAAASLLALAASAVAAEEGYYQYPSARGDTLVFASEGDLWRAPRGGGMAVRLTNHEEEESNAALSPDGTMVAFNAAYDSTGDVYVMPVSGGAPKRLTFESGGVRTVGWTPEGRVVFATNRHGGGLGEILYTVAPDGGEPQAIPLWRANAATFGSDPNTLFFQRRGLDMRANDNAVQYRGGGTAQLWRWQMGSQAEATQLLADHAAGIRMPMAWNGRIYFISDQSGGDAVWSVAEDGSGVRQHSAELPFPVLQASLDNGEIFLQNGADLHVYSIAGNTMRRLDIDLVTDREQTRERALENPLRNLTAAHVSPSGESVALTARGRVALGFTSQRRRIEFPVPLDARAREAVAGPEGAEVFAIIDQDVRGDIYRMPADGTGAPVAVTRGYDSYIWEFDLSPDGKTIVVADKAARLQKIDVATGRVTELARNATGNDNPFSGVTFSPDGKFIAYAEDFDGGTGYRGSIFVQDLASGRRVRATSDKYSDFAPAFAHDGAWLYFLSERNFSPNPGYPWGDRNMGVAFPDRGEIYALQLDPASEFRFVEENELSGEDEEAELGAAGSAEDSKKEDEEEEDTKPAPANIVLEGLADRLYKVPGAAGVEGALFAAEDFLFTRRGEDIVSVAISKNDPKIETFAAKALGFELSADRKTAFVVSGPPDSPAMALVPVGAKMPDTLDPHRVRLADWKLLVDPQAEWQQMFVDAWRMHRDFAYDPALRGVDWNAVRARHEPLVARIGHRAELNAILSQMSSQLGILHSQVGGGDVPRDTENAELGFLGAETSPVAGGLRIDAIYRSDEDIVSMRPPLTRPGVDARVGDVITRVDGRPVRTHAELAQALTAKVGQEVRLDLTRGGRSVSAIVQPMNAGGEYMARWFDRVQEKRAETDRLSGGDIGYVALKAMGGDDVAAFARDFFPQLDKDGLIIDVRGNNGGNVDSIVIAQLMRRVWAYWATDGGRPYTNMQGAFRGHIAVLIDERTYSDGETFAAGMKSLGLAPLIGTRTAGAGIWLSGRNPLTDNGMARIAEYAQYGLDGRWLIEGWGVAPDIEVENLPHASFEGQDAQLEAAVGWLEAKIAAEPVRELVPLPLPPVGEPGRDAYRLDR